MPKHRKDTEQRQLKALKLLGERSRDVEEKHQALALDVASTKARAMALSGKNDTVAEAVGERQRFHLDRLSVARSLDDVDVEELYRDAELKYPGELTVGDLLNSDDQKEVEERIARYIDDFNGNFGLDRWDYAIACSCGLVGSMFDVLCVSAPPKPTVSWNQKVDGIFNRGVQQAFNNILPPELSAELAKANPIGSADTSSIHRLIKAPPKTLNPTNHRLRTLSHDPVLGFVFGVLDMMRGTCTVVGDNGLQIFQGKQGGTGTGLFTSLGRMFGHLASDVNAPSKNLNRGMGLPAPFMGLLRMFNSLPVGDSNLGKQVEYMYVSGYDFRQFVTTSIPVAIMEVMMRALYAVKQVSTTNSTLGEVIFETLPGRMNPRFRIMLVIGYTLMCGVNAGKMYVSKDLMNLNYAAWMGLFWNGPHAIKWLLLDKHLKLWDDIEIAELDALRLVIGQLDHLEAKVENLPV